MLYDGYVNEQETEKTDDSGARKSAENYFKEKQRQSSNNNGAKASGSSNSNSPNVTASNTAQAGGEAAKASASGAATGANAAGTASTTAASGANAAGAAGGASAGTAVATTGAAAGKAAVVAGSAASAASTAGITLAIQLALLAIKKAKNEIKSLGTLGTVEDDYKLKFSSIFLIVIPLFLITFGSYIFKIIPGSNENYKETSYSYTLEEDDRATIEKEFSTSVLDAYAGTDPLLAGAQAYILGVDADTGFQNAMHKAISDKCHNIVKNLGQFKLYRLFSSYDKERSLATFYANPWPYDLQTGADPDGMGAYPCIGNVLGVTSYGYSAYTPTYNDVNYAEVLSVLSQNPDYNWENCRYEAYNEHIRSDVAQNLYYELKVEWMVVYTGTNTITDDDGKTYSVDVEKEFPFDTEDAAYDFANANSEVTLGGTTYQRDCYYCNIKIKPFGLRELYLLAEVAPAEPHIDFYHHTNEEMLDWQEHYERTYLRDNVEIAGPSYAEPRNPLSTIYQDLTAYYGEAKGRSAWSYIDNPYNLSGIDLSAYGLTDEYLKLLEEFEKLPEGSCTLENFIDFFYRNQGTIQSLSGKSGLCNFTTYMMIAMYYSGNNLSYQQMAEYAKKWCAADGTFNGQAECKKLFGFSVSGNIKTNIPATIESQIDSGNPVILHIRGQWTGSDGTKYHSTSNGHFLVIRGYTSEGIYVADPGKQANNDICIPWEDLASVNDLYIRTTSG